MNVTLSKNMSTLMLIQVRVGFVTHKDMPELLTSCIKYTS